MRVLAALLALGSLGATAADPPTLDDVLKRASAYVVKFEQTLSSLVAEERYQQRLFTGIGAIRPGARNDTQGRILKSDFLLVRSERSEDWVPFRDVFEVDGQAVREREDRLMKLFVEAPGDAFEQAERISNESARYNIGPIIRTINVPTLPLKFLDPANIRRSSFEKAGETRLDGIPVWEVDFEEVTVPTLIRTNADRSLPAQGMFWIDPATGAVLKSQLRLRPADLRSEIQVTYHTHQDLDIRVPAELKEKYQGLGFELEGVATYGRVRRFRVTTEEVIDEKTIKQ